MILYNKEQVKNFLPHRHPFLFIDEVYAVNPPEGFSGEIQKPSDLEGGQVECGYYVDPQHPIFEGHFPGNPILPGVIQIEMMAQASAFLPLMSKERKIEDLEIETTLLGVNSTKFRKPIYPGNKLLIRGKMTKTRGWILTYDCKIFIDDIPHSETSILASIKF